MSYRAYPKPHTQVRIVCSNPTHTMHCYEYKTIERATEQVTELNERKTTMGVTPPPAHQGCVPWTVEVRMVTGWSDLGMFVEEPS